VLDFISLCGGGSDYPTAGSMCTKLKWLGTPVCLSIAGILSLVVPAAHSATTSVNSTYYFPQLAVGGGFQTILTYVNYSAQSVTCQTTFFSDSGAALQVSFADTGTASSRTDNLGPGADIHVQTQSAPTAANFSGWAVGQCTGPVKASLLYRFYSGATAQGEASVEASTTPATEFVTFAQTQTGIAYANPSPTPAVIKISALDSTGRALGNTSITLQPNAHGAANIGPLLGLTSFTGSVQISSTVPIVSLSLNAEAFPVFSSLPPGDLPTGTALAGHLTGSTAAASSPASTYYFPQLAVGGGFQTTLTYVNYSTQSVICQTTFFSDSGAALQISFADTGTASSRTDNLGPGADIHVETQSAPTAANLSGWAVGQCTGPVKASLLYRFYNGATAQGEASVEASTTPTTEFVTFVQTQAGIAYANPSSSPAVITLSALDSTGRVLGKTSITLQPNAHGAANIAPLLGLSPFVGSVQISSTEPIVSLSLNAEAFPVFSSLPPGDLPTGTTLGAAGPWVSITSIWSNQLGNGVIANYLPGGAGIRGNSENYILMGTDSGNAIQAGASIQIPAGIDTSHLTVRLAYVNDDATLTTLGTGSLVGETASLTVPQEALLSLNIGSAIPVFEVVAFQDSNGNGTIDSEELVARSNPNRFQVITRARYDLALLDFTVGAFFGGFSYPNAAALLSAFISGTTPGQASSSQTMVFTSQLSHSVGTTFTTGQPNASGMIPQYTFPQGSMLSGAVLQSNAFNNSLTTAAAMSCAAPQSSQVTLQPSIVFGAADPDLFFSFHTATLSVTLTESPGQAMVKGYLTKLYNWDLEGAGNSPSGQLFDPMGASLQAGFPTMGTNGVIFSAVVQFNDPVTVPPCPLQVSPAGGFSASGQPGSVSGSMTYNLQDTGTIPIAFAASVNVPWITLSRASGTLQPGASSTVIVSTNAAANAQSAGSYTGTITFSSGSTVVTRTATLVITATTPQIQSLTISPSSVASGGTAVGTVALAQPAPAGGVLVSLSAASAVASVPATVTVSAGTTSAMFSIGAGTVSSSQSVTITASFGGSSAQATLTVLPSSGGNGPMCELVTQGTYEFTFWNTLPTDTLVQFGDVILPNGTHGGLSFGYQMNPNECDLDGLPEPATYAVDISRADNDGNPVGTVTHNTITVSETGAISFNLAPVDAVIITQSNCNATGTLEGVPAFNLCIP
jgi:hypothetical protein